MSDKFRDYIEWEIEGYRGHLRGEKKSENTVNEYSLIVKNMLKYLRKRAEDITLTDLNRYKMYLSTRKRYSKNSLYLAVKAIRSYFRYKGLDTANKLTSPKRPKQMPKYLSEEEVKRLLEVSRENPRDYAIISLLAYSGLRVSELCNLRLEDVDFNERVIYVHSGKGDRDRIVVVSARVIEAIQDYLLTREDDMEYLFSSQKSEKISRVQVFRIVKKYAKKAGIKKEVTPHVLRHTLATTLLRRGVDIRFIQQFLGHSSVATTQIYTHVDDALLKSVYDRVLQEY